MKLNRIWLIGLFSVSFFSCRKKVVDVNSDFIDHFYYKQGTYWVYIDTASGHYDSLAVKENTTSTFTNPDNQELSQMLGVAIIDFSNPNITLNISLKARSLLEISVVDNNRTYPTSNMLYPFYISSSSLVKNYYTQFVVNGITYPNVVEVVDDYVVWYISDSVGLVAFYSDKMKWQLKRSKMVM